MKKEFIWVVMGLLCICFLGGCQRKSKVYDEKTQATQTPPEQNQQQEQAASEEREAMQNVPTIDISAKTLIQYFTKLDYTVAYEEKNSICNLSSPDQFFTLKINSQEEKLKSIEVYTDASSTDKLLSSESKKQRFLDGFENLFHCIGLSYKEKKLLDFVKDNADGQSINWENKITMYAQCYDGKYVIILSGVA